MASVAVIGAGYVGLTTGACLSALGHNVACVDTDRSKVEKLQNGVIPIFEPGLTELVSTGLEAGNLTFTQDVQQAVESAEFSFLCLPTPELPDGSADTSFVRTACLQIKDFLRPDSVLVYKSTVPIMSEGQIENWVNRSDISIASNPEFLREGSAVYDFMNPDRIVVGSRDERTRTKVASLYETLNAPTVLTDCRSSETIKYLANAFLALKISFINETARFCDVIDADIGDVRLGLVLDPRIGSRHFAPGPGWGGSCFPKDTKALIHSAVENGFDFQLVRHAVQSNDYHQQELAALIVRHALAALADRNKKPVIGALGLTFKAGTDDLRRSPSLAILSLIRPHVEEIRAYDPIAADNSGIVDIHGRDVADAVRGCDAVVVLTEWDEFSKIDPQLLKAEMRGNVVIDTRYILDRERYETVGLQVIAVGAR